ncbi:major facilitator superfamily domain-containing protein [Rhypophila decipiens]|uniref:Major facilitator superfamily domain-containing protein n=1 Tax=Rhypophila decipiens TaxID=261697 RepID=A0AAN7BDY8_9PEZI|nr:major facilitator superfamily domain-containing protein [Rhypophila decipiens]
MSDLKGGSFGLAHPSEVPVADTPEKTSADKEAAATHGSDESANENQSDDEISQDAQAGVQAIEAFTKVWTTPHIIMAYVTIWIIIFVDAMQSSMSSLLTPYVTSSFKSHSLTATTGIMANIISGLAKLPLAKVLDIWGRPQGFASMVFCLTLGLIMMAACVNVEMYAAGQVFYWIGYNGVAYCSSVFIADTSSLKNRAFMMAFITSPYIITMWIGGPLAAAFMKGPGFQWAFGTFAIVTPFICSPLLILFIINYRKAAKLGLLPKRESNRTAWESIKHYAIEFDLAGILILAAGLALFLLAFNIYSYQAEQWRSPLIICFLVLGLLLMIAFPFYEKYVAPVTFLPYHLLLDRTVMGACILAAVSFVSFYIWNSFFPSFLQVVNNLDLNKTNLVSFTYNIGSCFWSFVVAFAIHKTGRFKWLALYFGVPMNILGIGLMIKFRQVDQDVGLIVMCQVFIAFAGGTLVICQQMAAMAVVTHQHVATVLALESMFSSIGGAIGSTITTAIWTGTFPGRLYEHLPAEVKDDYMTISRDITVQLGYEYGSPTRHAIAQAYGDSQRYMLIAAAAIQVVSFVAVWAWRDINVKEFKQVKGRVI